MKVLNLYAGIGGNRKLWTDCDVTAVEKRKDIAGVYSYYFPNDTMIVGDAHEYLLNHYNEYDFIWTSTPCPTHSRANFWASKTATNRKKYYPDMTLYQEIIFLKNWYNGLWCAENVKPYYDDILIEPTKKLGRHLFWSNFTIGDFNATDADIFGGARKEWSELHGFDLTNHKIESRKDQIYRNCVHPETGLHIFNCAKTTLKNETKHHS